ncbi:MAG: phosphohistidine phosphatase SixA [Desulfobacterium sp.]|nr:phosphohistidine phosphatase SixA [Desulfobacterium sp.]
MALYLVQHGKSRPKQEDSNQGLSDQGRADTERIAQVAKGYGVPVAMIQHSGKERARKTAEIFADFLAPRQGVVQVDGIKPMDDVERFAGSVDPAENAMVIGHLPFMEKLVGFLVAGDLDNRVFRFQNSGIVCLDRDDTGWFISWTLMPNIG